MRLFFKNYCSIVKNWLQIQFSWLATTLSHFFHTFWIPFRKNSVGLEDIKKSIQFLSFYVAGIWTRLSVTIFYLRLYQKSVENFFSKKSHYSNFEVFHSISNQFGAKFFMILTKLVVFIDSIQKWKVMIGIFWNFLDISYFCRCFAL